MDGLEPHQGQTLVGLADRVPASRTTARDAGVPPPPVCARTPFWADKTKEQHNAE